MPRSALCNSPFLSFLKQPRITKAAPSGAAVAAPLESVPTAALPLDVSLSTTMARMRFCLREAPFTPAPAPPYQADAGADVNAAATAGGGASAPAGSNEAATPPRSPLPPYNPPHSPPQCAPWVGLAAATVLAAEALRIERMAGPKVVSSSTSGRGDEGGTCGCGNGGSGGGGAGGCLEPASRRRPSGAARAVRNIRALAWEPLGLDLPDGGGGGGGGLLFPALLAHALDLTGPVIANNSISKTGPKAGVGINGAPAFEAEIALGVMAALPAPALLRASLGGPLPPANCPRTASAHGTGAADGATGAPPGRPVPAGAPLHKGTCPAATRGGSAARGLLHAGGLGCAAEAAQFAGGARWAWGLALRKRWWQRQPRPPPLTAAVQLHLREVQAEVKGGRGGGGEGRGSDHRERDPG